MLVIGLTGGIGSGKTTVADRFQELGAPVIDADQISRELTAPGNAGYVAVLEAFGDDILSEPNGPIDRKKLRQIVFRNRALRHELEEIMHPLIRGQMQKQLSTIDAPYCILVIPLLLETGQDQLVDRILVIDLPEEEQLRRVMVRDGSPVNVIQGIMEAQLDRESRLTHADDVIENIGDLDELYTKVDALAARYKDMAASLNPRPQPTTAAADPAPVQNPAIPGQISLSAMPWLEQRQASNQESASADENAGEQFVYFDLPLTERLRTLMRLEGLFEEMDHCVTGTSVWDSRSALRVVMAILNTLNRPDVKTDLIKEMDRLFNVMSRFRSVDGVDLDRLVSYQNRLREMSQTLRAISATIGLSVRQDDLIAAIKQRESIPGGPAPFDLPALNFWLHQDLASRRADMVRWLNEFSSMRQAVDLILEVVRKSALPTEQTAENGTYQLILDSNVNYQLIRLVLPKGSRYCAEISGGRHRFGIRFTQIQGTSRPIQIKESVTFKLYCCAI